MAEFLGVVKLGTLYYKYGGPAKALRNPKNPVSSISYWSSDPGQYKIEEIKKFVKEHGGGDINEAQREYDSVYDEFFIGDTSSKEDEQLQWVKIRNENKILYICDRVILNNLEPKYNKNLSEPKEIVIDGTKYICRSLKLCMGEISQDPNADFGATIVVKSPKYYDPKTQKDYYCEDEWADYILNKKGIKGLPKPKEYDLEKTLDIEKAFNGEHNKLWHWFCEETISPILNPSGGPYGRPYFHNIRCGGRSADYWGGEKCDHGYFQWRPVLECLKPAPKISDTDRHLGDKNKGFSISYTVSDMDTVKVTEKLNGTVIKTINNAPQNEELSINIDKETLYKLPLNSESKITIEVDDGYGGISYRNYTFTRTNTAPIINGQDKELGVVDRSVKQSYTVYDEENDSINIVESLDDIKLKDFKAESNKEYEISIPTSTWIRLKNGQHKLTIAATDSNNATSIRTYTFTKKETKIDLTLKNALKTDDRANKILITPVWQGIENANVKVEVCNNANDKEPTWEDCTKSVLANQHYNFTNKEKTANTWGINIKFNIEKKEKVEEEIYFNGFGGAFE